MFISQVRTCQVEHEFILEGFPTSFTNVKKKKNPILTFHISPVVSEYPGENTQQCNVCGKDLTPKSQDRNIMEPYFPDSVVVANLYLFHFMFSDDFSSGTQQLQ